MRIIDLVKFKPRPVYTCASTGQTLIDDISGAMFNVVFTSVPILVYALTDRPAPDNLLLSHPHLYKSTNDARKGSALRPAGFWRQVDQDYIYFLAQACYLKNQPAMRSISVLYGPMLQAG